MSQLFCESWKCQHNWDPPLFTYSVCKQSVHTLSHLLTSSWNSWDTYSHFSFQDAMHPHSHKSENTQAVLRYHWPHLFSSVHLRKGIQAVPLSVAYSLNQLRFFSFLTLIHTDHTPADLQVRQILMQSLLTLFFLWDKTVHGLPCPNSTQLLHSLTHVCVHLHSVSHEPGLVNQSWKGKRLMRYFPFVAELLAIHRLWERAITVLVVFPLLSSLRF